MTLADFQSLLPLIVVSLTALTAMVLIPVARRHGVTAGVTVGGLALSLASLWFASGQASHPALAALLALDAYSRFYMGLILAGALMAALLSYGYLDWKPIHRDEFYVLLVLASLGAMILVASAHFVSFVLGLEILSVSLFAMIAYRRTTVGGLEAGVKYLVLGGLSSAVLLFGMALIYAETGTMRLAELADRVSANPPGILVLAGLAGVIVGIGFKLALVPFHLWTPDVYQGAPAPVSGFIATVSKGAMFALLLRYFGKLQAAAPDKVFWVFAVIAVASMFAGNLLALRQNSVKRLLAYSSIANLGYLLIAYLAGGAMGAEATGFYLVAYFIAVSGAFGVIGAMSEGGRDADAMEDFSALAWRRPWAAWTLAAMLLSLAGLPLAAGFVGKFYVVMAGLGAGLWTLVVLLVVNSALGLYYYLRVIVVMFSEATVPAPPPGPRMRWTTVVALAFALVALVALGVYPAPLLTLIRSSVAAF